MLAPNFLGWVVYEVVGLDTLDATSNGTDGGAGDTTSMSTGTTPSTTIDDIAAFAAHVIGNSTAPVATDISGHTGGFAERDEVLLADGATEVRLSVSACYPGAAGTLECTASWTPGAANQHSAAALVAYRAETTVSEKRGAIITSG
jgi:hypothetical protein